MKRRIEHYTSNRETKDFIVEQAHLTAPEVREKHKVERFPKIAHGRCINFVAGVWVKARAGP